MGAAKAKHGDVQALETLKKQAMTAIEASKAYSERDIDGKEEEEAVYKQELANIFLQMQVLAKVHPGQRHLNFMTSLLPKLPNLHKEVEAALAAKDEIIKNLKNSDRPVEEIDELQSQIDNLKWQQEKDRETISNQAAEIATLKQELEQCRARQTEFTADGKPTEPQPASSEAVQSPASKLTEEPQSQPQLDAPAAAKKARVKKAKPQPEPEPEPEVSLEVIEQFANRENHDLNAMQTQADNARYYIQLQQNKLLVRDYPTFEEMVANIGLPQAHKGALNRIKEWATKHKESKNATINPTEQTSSPLA